MVWSELLCFTKDMHRRMARHLDFQIPTHSQRYRDARNTVNQSRHPMLTCVRESELAPHFKDFPLSWVMVWCAFPNPFQLLTSLYLSLPGFGAPRIQPADLIPTTL